MRKTSLFILAMVILVSMLYGCNGDSDVIVKTPSPTPNESSATATKAPTASPTPTEEPTPKPTLDLTNLGDELYLTLLDYEEFYLHGDDEPFYGFIPHTGEDLEVNGIRYENGIFINPVSGSDDGYIIYNIEGLPYDRFVAKVGKLDVFHGNGDPVVFRVYVDGELVAESEEMVQGDDAYLFDVEIGEGKKELLLECSVVTMDHTECSGVFGDARLCYKGSEVSWPS